MRFKWILVVPVLALVGCATGKQKTKVPEPSASPPPAFAAVMPTKWVETPYEVQSYRAAANSEIRHAAHAVYRRTKVHAKFDGEMETMSRERFAPASVALLPASDELAAEIETQRDITRALHEAKTSVVAMGKQMQTQYTALVKQNAEADALRTELIEERARLRATSEQLQQTLALQPDATPASTEAVEARW